MLQHQGRTASRYADIKAFGAAILRHPHQIGAVAQTGRRMAAKAAELIPDGAPLVVELGPGAGSVSDAIHERLPAEGSFLAVEANTAMVKHLGETRPWLYVVDSDASRLPEILSTRNLGPADVIVSELPWTLWNTAQQTAMMDSIVRSLASGGVFCTVVTMSAWPWPAARRFRRQMYDRFATVWQDDVVWANMPPACWLVGVGPLHR